LQNGFAIVYREGHSIAAFHMPQHTGAAPQIKAWLPETARADEDVEPNIASQPPPRPAPTPTPTPRDLDAAILAAAQRPDLPIFATGDIDYALGTAALKQGGTVVVGQPMPYGMSATMTRFQTAVENYW